MRTLLLCLFLAGFASVRAAELPLSVDLEKSHIECDVRATLHSFTAKLATYDVAISLRPDTLQVVRAQLHFRFADLRTGKDERDQEMLAWQNTDQFPECVFTLVSREAVTAGQFTARGTFLFHGQSREISFPVKMSTNGDLHIYDGEFEIDVRDYGLPPVRKYFVAKVSPVVKVRFHLEGRPGKLQGDPNL